VTGSGGPTATGESDTRGFSTSASFLIVFIGLFIALGTLHTATANTAERVADARDDQRERHQTVLETGVTVTNATWNDSSGTLVVRVENTGESTLSVDAADTVVDGAYVGIEDYELATVDGQDTGVWTPGETLVLEDTDTVVGFDDAPSRVQVVTGPGVADATEVVAA
jgi:flagellar protein FlaF